MADCCGKHIFPTNSMNLLDFSGESHGTNEVVTTFQNSGACIDE